MTLKTYKNGWLNTFCRQLWLTIGAFFITLQDEITIGMTKSIFKILATTALGVSVVACNSEGEVINPSLSSSALISAFSLEANDKVLANLDSVFFSIDVVNGKIYNADSLPYGTRIKGLVPVISTDAASVVELSIPRPNLEDSIVNYLENTTDSVDFSNGPVKVRVVSTDGKCERTYRISVNVHQVKPDSLVWDRVGTSNLPSLFQIPAEQHTTYGGGKYYCLTSQSGRYSMAVADNPAGPWTIDEFGPAFTPAVGSLCATDNALYILDTDGHLYKGSLGGSWQVVDNGWHHIYGNYGNTLWGSRKVGDRWYRVSYPEGRQELVENNFPVSGTSQTLNYTFEMSERPQMLMTGGRLADGSLTGATWGYDGRAWACISQTPIQYPLADAVVVPYFTSKVNTNNWTVTRSSVLLAMFGSRADGTLNDTVYMSPDFGITWRKAPDLLQMAKTVPPRACAQGFVAQQTIEGKSQSVKRFEDSYAAQLPAGARWDDGADGLTTLATRPVTSWECPYIYVFGGQSTDGQTYNTVWRGVIRRFTFKPLY